MSKDNLEIERKFLLKKVPDFNKNQIKKKLIHQIYIDIDGKINRFREIVDLSSSVENKYIHCVKRPISKGVFEEIEEEISKEEFVEMSQKNHSYVIKTRYVYEHGGLNWEIDYYNDIRLVTMEVELDDIDQKIEIPDLIKKEIITEVTGQKEFSNYNLSLEEK